MDVGYISSSIVPSKEANSVQVMNMCSAFSAFGNDVTLYCSPGDGREDPFQYYGVDHEFKLRYGRRPDIGRFGKLLYACDLYTELINNSHDILYSRNIYPLVPPNVGRPPIIYESHQPPGHRIRRHVEKRVFTKSNFRNLVTISEALKRAYVDEFESLSATDVIVAHDAAAPIDSCDELNNEVESDSLTIGYIGSPSPGKGIEMILEVANVVGRHEFHLVGVSMEDIERYDTPSSENITCHGHVPHSQIGNYVIDFDILIAPYQQHVEPRGGGQNIARYMSPLKIFEYMSANKPIICSDMPVLREVLSHKKNAYLVDPSNVSAWKEAIEELECPELRVQLADTAFETYRDNYTWEKRVEKIISKCDF